MRRIVLAFAVLALTSGLVGSAAGASALKRHTVPGEGISLAVPASWVVVDSRLTAEAVDHLLRENPKFAPFLQSLRSTTGPTKFIALDPHLRNGFATNVNVVVTPVASWMTFSVYRRALALESGRIAKSQVEQKIVTIHGVRAVRIRYQLEMRLAGKAVTVQTLQYAFLRPARSIVVTYTTPAALAGLYARAFARSAATIRFSGE
jgi:hypothetical protein